MTTANTPRDRYARVTDDYRDVRAKLETAAGELERLKDQRAATMQSSRDAGRNWRQIFKDAGGAAGKEVRELQAEERTLAAEVEQLDVLIAELTPHVAELRHWAGQLRKQHIAHLTEARRNAAINRLNAAMADVFEKPEGQELLEALAQRADSAQREVIEDNSFMAGIGFDGHEASRPGFMAKISGDDRRKIADEADKRKRALIADAVLERLAALDDEKTRFEGDLEGPLAPLACER